MTAAAPALLSTPDGRMTQIPVSGPSGLSDYAVSPLGMPTALLRNEVRVAFLARTSTEDQQDPRQSILRQLGNSKAAIPESWVIVAHFYDVESGRMDLASRGRGENYERFDIPIARDGGITELLTEAASPKRRFDVVICENIARVARRAFEGLSVERELERNDVPLFGSNEPITDSGSSAQRILQRRINQSVAEYEVLNTLEQSWGGLCTHVREGWNIGKPCHGYKAKVFKHPNPAKAAKGYTKSRLEPDDLKGETVTQIALWRYYERLGCDTIADRLNADLDKYPPPEPPGKRRARGVWGRSSVYDILRNPKYTGYQVFNRRATRSRRGKHNDPIKWVWSPAPVHEPLIPKWMYDAINAGWKSNQGSRDGTEPTNKHPATVRTYLFRGRMFHECGRRMFGDPRHGRAYYLCRPNNNNNNRGRPDRFADHEKVLYLREDSVLDAVAKLFADRVFGPDRRAILEADLERVDDHVATEREAERDRIRRKLAEIDKQQASILKQAQQGDPDDPFTTALRGSYNNLAGEEKRLLAKITELDEADLAATPKEMTADDLPLIDALPYLAMNLALAPAPYLQALFEAVQLAIMVHDDGEHATITIKLPADQLPEITHVAERITDVAPSHELQREAAPELVGMLRVPPVRFELTLDGF
ncbi:recombinase family protein [Amycolatopsis coloradensis]|uniref:Recombinase family protein n=1 Tax=Amycolatopsis coloradensis TaxID=76021 RepID=A0ACD5BDA6_9PSEU